MSQEVSKNKGKGAKEYKPIVRKATFVKETEKDQTIWRPVNKRAHKWAKKVGKRTKLTRDDMKAIKASKRVKLYAYEAGVLKAVRV